MSENNKNINNYDVFINGYLIDINNNIYKKKLTK